MNTNKNPFVIYCNKCRGIITDSFSLVSFRDNYLIFDTISSNYKIEKKILGKNSTEMNNSNKMNTFNSTEMNNSNKMNTFNSTEMNNSNKMNTFNSTEMNNSNKMKTSNSTEMNNSNKMKTSNSNKMNTFNEMSNSNKMNTFNEMSNSNEMNTFNEMSNFNDCKYDIIYCKICSENKKSEETIPTSALIGIHLISASPAWNGHSGHYVLFKPGIKSYGLGRNIKVTSPTNRMTFEELVTEVEKMKLVISKIFKREFK